MSEKGNGGGAKPGPGGGQPPQPPDGGPPRGGDPGPEGTKGGGGGAKAPEKKPPTRGGLQGGLDFPDGGRLMKEGDKWRYTDPDGRTGNWTGDSWVDEAGKPMPDDFRGRAPDPNRVRDSGDWDT